MATLQSELRQETVHTPDETCLIRDSSQDLMSRVGQMWQQCVQLLCQSTHRSLKLRAV